MKKFLSIATLSVAAAGIAIASYSVFNKKRNQDENIDDLLYTDGFDDEFDDEDGSYFDVHIDTEDELDDMSDVSDILDDALLEQDDSL